MTIINSQITAGGIQPTGTIQITTNGTHDVTNYATADVQVPTTAPALYREFSLNSNGLLVTNTTTSNMMSFAGMEGVSFSALYQAYKGNTNISGPVDMSSLMRIQYDYSCTEMFNGCTGITSVDLSALTNVSGTSSMSEMFNGCTGITSVDLSALTSVDTSYSMLHMFNGCTGITSVDLSALTTISGTSTCESMFYGCTSLRYVDLSSLATITGNSTCTNMFRGCTSLESVDLSSLTSVSGNNSMSNMFYGCTSLQTVTLSDAVTKRNPVSLLNGAPVQTCPYENCEYICVAISGLCQGNHFSHVNMGALEMCNSSNTYMFAENTYLEEAKFPVFTRWNGANNAAYMFYGCTNANFTDVYFPMLCVMRNAVPFNSTSFPSQLTVHFRKDQQSLIEGTTGYPFGAASCVFDQVGTITVNSVDYIRQGKCNETGYYAWQKSTANITVGGVAYVFDMSQITRNTVPVIKGPMLYGWTNGSTTIFTDSLKPQVGDFIWTAFNVAQSTTDSITAVSDNDYVYTVDSAEPEVNDTVYSDTLGTVLGTISAVA